MCSYKVGFGGEMKIAVGSRAQIMNELRSLPWESAVCFSHNALFDMSILLWHFGITPAYTLCTMTLWGAVMGVRYRSSLMVVAQTLGLPAKMDAVHQMDGKHLADLTQAELKSYMAYCDHDTYLCYEISKVLIPRFTEVEFHNCHAAIQMYTQAKLVLNMDILLAAQKEEAVRRANLYAICREHLGISHMDDAFMKGILSSNDKLSELLTALGVDVPTKQTKRKVKGFEEKQPFTIPAFAKSDVGFEALLESEDPVIADICEARLLAKSTQPESRVERMIGVASRGTLPTPIRYAGAAVTQRYAAAVDKLNLQNLKRGSKLRDAVEAPKGYKIVGGDLSQIELRFGWLVAGEYDKLARFASGHDPYKQIMTDTFGMDYDTMESWARTVGKVINLSAIFGTGWERAQDTVRLQARRVISEEDAKKLIRIYREGHPHLKHAWDQGTQALEALICKESINIWHEGWGQVLAPDPNDIFLKYGAIQRPGGLRLQYPNLKKQKGAWPDGRPKDEYLYLRQRERGGSKTVEYIYGAKVYQNFVQAGARDVIAESISAIVQSLPPHWFIVGQVHDELWLLVPDEETAYAAQWLEKKLTTTPLWAPALPLACETYVAQSYGDGK